MEQQKMLWTGLAAAFVLILVTLVAFLWMTSAKDNNPIAVTKGSLPASDVFKPIDPAAVAKDDNPLIMEPTVSPVSGFEGKMPDANGVTVEKDSNTTANNSSSKTVSATPSTVKSTTATPVPKAATPAPKASATPKKGTTAPATPTVEYYIQVGSYSSQSIAEEAKVDMKERGLAAMITIKTVDGKDYYRLRIGPYQNKEEANKFLDWVKAIKAYSASYLTETKK